MNRWWEYFQELLNPERENRKQERNPTRNYTISGGHYKKKIIKKFKRGKAAGHVQNSLVIITKFWKKGQEYAHKNI